MFFFQLSCSFPCFDYFLWFYVFFRLDPANDCIVLFIDSLVDESDSFFYQTLVILHLLF